MPDNLFQGTPGDLFIFPQDEEAEGVDTSSIEATLDDILARLQAIEEEVSAMSGDDTIIRGERNDNDLVAQSGNNRIRISPFSEQVVAINGMGQFFEAARRGKVFELSTAVGATLNGLTNPLAAGGTALLALHNPLGSNSAAVMLRASCTVVSGATATVAAPCWNYIPTPTGITAAGSNAAINTLFQGAQSNIRTFVNAALTGSTTATFLRQWRGTWGEPRHAGAASETGQLVMTEETDGSLIVPPGVCLIANIAQSGAALTGSANVLYAEIPWPL